MILNKFKKICIFYKKIMQNQHFLAKNQYFFTYKKEKKNKYQYEINLFYMIKRL